VLALAAKIPTEEALAHRERVVPQLSSNNLPTSAPWLLSSRSVTPAEVHQLDQLDKHKQLGRIQPTHAKCNSNNNNVDDDFDDTDDHPKRTIAENVMSQLIRKLHAQHLISLT